AIDTAVEIAEGGNAKHREGDFEDLGEHQLSWRQVNGYLGAANRTLQVINAWGVACCAVEVSIIDDIGKRVLAQIETRKEILEIDRFAIADEDDAALDHVLQLADVAWPV
ncbi:MAG: hypothetical protein P8Z77_11485, partial [Candidatus Thiodiazotropha sp.]